MQKQQKMKPQNLLLLFLSTFTLYIALLTLKQHLSSAGRIYAVRIINGFSNNSSLPLVVWCVGPRGGDDIGGRALQERDDYSWTVRVGFGWWRSTGARFVCTVKWDRMRRKFEAFRERRDEYRCGGGGGQCLWLVKEDGFYFSNNGIKWIKDFAWRP